MTVRDSQLVAALEKYLEVRNHTLSTLHIPYPEKLTAEVEYVVGEVNELEAEIRYLVDYIQRTPDVNPVVLNRHLLAVYGEIADVLLSTTTLCTFLPGNLTPEECIAYKTEEDRGRG